MSLKNNPLNIFSYLGILLLPLAIGVLFGLESCSDSVVKKHFCEGYIEYAIEYDDSIIAPRFNPSMRPSKMVIKFKDNNTINKIEGLSGAFSFAFIQNKQQERAYMLIKLLNKKLYYQEPLQENSYPFAYQDMPKFTIEKTDRVEEYLGYQCNVAVATFDDTLHNAFNIYYTQEIDIAKPNANTPFEVIDGVMLKFTSIMFGQKMNIKASAVKQAKVSDDEFVIPLEYEQVGLEVVKDVVELLR
ncbi:MAG: hypothetical protein RBT19_12995 [Tenuifilaceae bacterium]|jgi:hypothetical protein|nr:hypothetical protein [Tenuifilaceae bacterium]